MVGSKLMDTLEQLAVDIFAREGMILICAKVIDTKKEIL